MRNHQVLQDFIAAWSLRDMPALMACLADDFEYAASIGPAPGEYFVGREAVRRGIERMWREDDGSVASIDQCEVRDDWGFVRWTYRWLDKERLPEIGCDLWRFEDGLLRRKDAYRKVRRDTPLRTARTQEARGAQTNDVPVRLAHAGDSDRLLELMRGLARFEGYLDRFSVTTADLLSRALAPSDKPPEFAALVAEAEGDIRGYAVVYEIAFTFDLRPTLVIKELFVDEGSRDRGIGEALMQAVLTRARAWGCGRIKWDVLPSNEAAKRFYARFGACREQDWEAWILPLNSSPTHPEESLNV
jgi:GNAT superfamily N-acetyltransferase/ketosteroid isomerase-like protein